MSVSVFSQVWKASDVYRLRGDLGDADRPVLRRSPAWASVMLLVGAGALPRPLFVFARFALPVCLCCGIVAV